MSTTTETKPENGTTTSSIGALAVPSSDGESHSAQINELAAALSIAQGKIEAARKDSTNPFFRSKYADLASCWDACRDPLTESGLSIVQLPSIQHEPLEKPIEVKRDNDRPATLIFRWQFVTVETWLIHSSGQFMRSSIKLVCSNDTPQAAGSACTYARRYALCAMVGIAPDEDDGNTGSGRPPAVPAQTPARKPAPDPTIASTSGTTKATNAPSAENSVPGQHTSALSAGGQPATSLAWLDEWQAAIAAATTVEAVGHADFKAAGEWKKLTDEGQRTAMSKRKDECKALSAARVKELRLSLDEPTSRETVNQKIMDGFISDGYTHEQICQAVEKCELEGTIATWTPAELNQVGNFLKTPF